MRRVIEHVKAQNWTAVAIDFVIVVVGVFIGIQGSNWNDARQEAARRTTGNERSTGEYLALLGQFMKQVKTHYWTGIQSTNLPVLQAVA